MPHCFDPYEDRLEQGGLALLLLGCRHREIFPGPKQAWYN